MTEPFDAPALLSGDSRIPETAKTPAAPARNRGLPPAGNLSTGLLKLIALFFMVIDHLGAVVFPTVTEMRILGRIAFPIYCWCMVVGFYRTRSVPKYLGRILLTGVLVQPLYAYVMNHMGTSGNLILDLYTVKPNIFLTLFLGLAGLWGIREKKAFSQIWAPAAVILLATVLKADYGWKGGLFILLLYAARTSRPAIAAVMTAFFLYWGTEYSLISSIAGIRLDYSLLPVCVQRPLQAFMRLETFGLLCLFFLLIPFRKNIRMPAWFSYSLYPAHLAVVLIVKILVKGI